MNLRTGERERHERVVEGVNCVNHAVGDPAVLRAQVRTDTRGVHEGDLRAARGGSGGHGEVRVRDEIAHGRLTIR